VFLPGEKAQIAKRMVHGLAEAFSGNRLATRRMQRRTLYRSDSNSGLAAGAGATPRIERAGTHGRLNAWAYGRAHTAEIEAQIREK
jgi:hypothetical protein